MLIADALSRAHLSGKQNVYFECELARHVCLIVSETNITKDKWNIFGENIDRYEKLQLLQKSTLEGWAKNRAQLSSEIKKYPQIKQKC